MLRETKLMRTLVIINETSVNNQYKERLQEFLRPTLEYTIENENKKIGKNLKTYTQAVGVKAIQKETKNHNPKVTGNDKNQGIKNKRIKGLENVIKNMEKQIEKLKEIIAVVCDKIVQDKVFKESIAVQLDKINEISEEKISVIIEDEMDNEEESTYPKMNKKQVTWDSTINMNQRKNIDSVSKKLRIRKNPTT